MKTETRNFIESLLYFSRAIGDRNVSKKRRRALRLEQQAFILEANRKIMAETQCTEGNGN